MIDLSKRKIFDTILLVCSVVFMVAKTLNEMDKPPEPESKN